jgi:hypothetical protein
VQPDFDVVVTKAQGLGDFGIGQGAERIEHQDRAQRFGKLADFTTDALNSGFRNDLYLPHAYGRPSGRARQVPEVRNGLVARGDTFRSASTYGQQPVASCHHGSAHAGGDGRRNDVDALTSCARPDSSGRRKVGFRLGLDDGARPNRELKRIRQALHRNGCERNADCLRPDPGGATTPLVSSSPVLLSHTALLRRV